MLDIKKEEIVKSSTVIWLKAKLKGYSSELLLTSNKLILNKRPANLMGLGIIGSIVGRMFKEAKGAVIFNVTLDEIKMIYDEKYGINRSVSIQLKNEQEYKVVMSKKLTEEWKALLEKIWT